MNTTYPLSKIEKQTYKYPIIINYNNDSMGGVFKVKVRKIGTSFGVLIPKKILELDKIKEGEEIEMTILKKKKISDIEKLFGITKGAGSFEREVEDDRV